MGKPTRLLDSRPRTTRVAFRVAILALLLCFASTTSASAGTDRDRAGASIVDGEVGSIASFPWLAYVQYRGAVDRFSCGGSVVAPRLVLTAAHCVLSGTGRVATASNFRVLTGRGDLREATPDRVSTVARILVFPEFDPARVFNDAALLVLASPVDVPPLALATSADQGLLAAGTPITVAGWGLTRVRPPRLPAVFRQGQSAVQSASFCRRRLSLVLPAYNPDSQLCVRGSTGLCNGDSGGPAVARRPDGTAVQIGIASLKSAADCRPAAPQVVARVDRVSAWVEAWRAAIESGGPAPAVVVPEVELPPLTRSEGELVAVLGLEADFGGRFRKARSLDGVCERVARERVKCRVQWLTGPFLYRGALTAYTALPREGSVYNYRYTIRRFRLRCWLASRAPLRACDPRVFKR
ncbi:MAG TPA: serine protease [Solirubrobacterales bacterium]|nr:serine protease [Solirubrobacterales bacterium]